MTISIKVLCYLEVGLLVTGPIDQTYMANRNDQWKRW